MAPPPALTSVTTLLSVPTRVTVCRVCGHAQSDDLPDTAKFYDAEYRISLASDDHDQLYAAIEGRPIYRTDHQAELVLSLADPRRGASVLDYGAGKATTLRKVIARRTDLVPHVFDVSDDYREHWDKWLQREHCAVGVLPADWQGRFDLVTAHFVLEHVLDPIEILRQLGSLLKSDGALFLSVPDAIANPGDLIVVDHTSHFSAASLERAFALAGFGSVRLDRGAFAGAIVAIAKTNSGASTQPNDPAQAAQAFVRLSEDWTVMGSHLDAAAASRQGRPSAIYGAGVYGSFIAGRIGGRIDLSCFIDRNPHVRAGPHMDRPVLAPDQLPSNIEVVYAGLNPMKARAILADVPEWQGRAVEIVYLD